MAAATDQTIFKVKPWAVAVPMVLIGLVFLPTTVVVLAALTPTFVARIVDTSPGRRLTVTVGAMNLVGALYFVHRIWATGHSVSDIGPTLGDTFGWLCALVGAAAGWVIFGAMPAIVGRIAAAQTAIRLRRLGAQQDKLVAEWGETVRGAYAVRAIKEEEAEAEAE
ncbi:hypothetical protein [Dongia sp.]|uniref:hypothetical protein n=1 Tax=Dongia sp. TaxID=1977262 RepID=UPI0035B3675B